MTTIHVTSTGDDSGTGTEAAPFRTINHAAQVALPGDTVLVHEGVYREWVKPAASGLGETRRITYAAAPGEHVRITGAEHVTGWTRDSGPVWTVTLPNAMFGDHNPYALTIEGDWVVRATEDEPRTHLGDVYLNGVSSYEALSKDELTAPARTEVVDHWTGRTVPVPDVEQTTRRWYAEVGANSTTIWASFAEADPNVELVEVNVRRSVFYPVEHGIDYITVRGFELAQAACPWAPPTADQPGLIGPNWAKGWVIEDNDIHDAKCSAVSIGKEASTGNNNFTKRHDKPGYQYQLESVFDALEIGWSKETIGSHVIRNNHIHHCGQNGVVGHLGCVFSRIHDNHIHDIATKREFFGHEIAGIKLHAALDVEIAHNHIHDCTLGVWLDWQTQGTRVTRNVMYDNCRDLFVEVSHGPYVVDHNVLASPASIESVAQGGAYVANLVGGTVRVEAVMNRATPYHRAHSTRVAGYGVIYSGDDRWVGNIFCGTGGDPTDYSAAYGRALPDLTQTGYGTLAYDGYPASYDEYLETIRAGLPGDLNIFLPVKNPVMAHGNLYLDGARAFDGETGPVQSGTTSAVQVTAAEGQVTVELTLPDDFASHRVDVPTTAALGRVRFPDLEFDGPDGGPIQLGTDLVGSVANGPVVPGPVQALVGGPNRVVVWG
ncbi:MAG TPA: right-handed parallel beta-helix repeat-containing protein [Propionibacteriaceae bacterium]|nr:right-handed parallel beta-helix repeat-containing protein [Propionibacteriaceae bacterium]